MATYPSGMLPALPEMSLWQRSIRQVGFFLLRQWAMLIMAFLGLIVLTAIAIPFLSYLGMDGIAKPLFFTLHSICAQIPSHSFYVLGHQLGLCARNFSIYGSMFVTSLMFVLSKKRMPGIPWWVWVLLCLPMAFDGFTQMFGLRESTWELRATTGALFGFGSMWFVLPLLQKYIVDEQTYQRPAALHPPASQNSQS